MDIVPFFLEPIDHLRNLRRRESPAREGIDRALLPDDPRKARAPFPDPLQRADESGFFRFRLPLGENPLHGLGREAARPKLPLEAPRAVALSPETHRGSRRAEVVQPSLRLQADERARDRVLFVAPVRECPRQLLAATGPDGEEAKRALARGLGRIPVGRGFPDRSLPVLPRRRDLVG